MNRDHSGAAPTIILPEEASECGIDVSNGNSDTVCSTKSAITAMKKKLEEKDVDTSPLTTDRHVVEKIKDELGCKTEKCVLTNPDFVRPEITGAIKESISRLKPKGPANTTALLNNNNIDEILGRLTNRFKKFYHMNFQMIDFAGVRGTNGEWKKHGRHLIDPTELGTVDIVKDVMDKGYESFGVVMNTDVRTGGGIHWFALYAQFNVDPITVEYFNSSGNKPVVQIQEWLAKTEEAIRASGRKVTVVALSGVVHQKDSDTECGLYSLYYIWNRLKGVPAVNFQKKRIPDAMMIKFRPHLFSS
jgi:hypothetical protein